MKSAIIHADGRRTDLAAAIDPDTYAELERPHPRTPATLWCGECGGSIYIRHGSTRTAELFGAHHRASDCAADLTIHRSQMSDEHKRQAEYHAKAAEQRGHTASLEVTTTGRTRVDVVIDDQFGIEVQRSALKKTAAVDRTARSIAAGLTSVTWFTDRDSRPQFTGHVPGYRSALTMARWGEGMPPLGTVGAAGLRIIEAVRCGTRQPCPHKPGISCGRFIAVDSPWLGLLIDDVVDGLAARQILPVTLKGNVQLMSTASIGQYEELTGTRLSYNPGPRKVALPLSDREECTLPLQMPLDAPGAVRAWFEAELARVQRDREERERAEREEQARQEAAERARLEQLERSRAAREQAERQYQAALQTCRQRREQERLEAQERDDRAQAYAEMLRKAHEAQERRQVTRCEYPRCRVPGSQHRHGIWCSEHARKMEYAPQGRGR